MKNCLYYGDNLDVLRRHVDDEFADLVYLDPPFKSDQNYNILFEEHDGTKAAAQILAFEDTWEWNTDAAASYEEMVELGGKVSEAMRAFKTFLGHSDMMAYLAMMAPRLVELRRVLKRDGSIYLHCDPTASHYLKLLMDAVFRPENFRNDIIWKRAETVKGNFGQGSKFFDRNTDSILFYTKLEGQFFKPQFKPYSDEYIKDFYKYTEEKTGRRYQLISMTGPGGAAKGNPKYEVMGVTRYWRYSKGSMEQLIKDGMVVQTTPGTVPRRKLYLDKGKGVSIQSLWDDVPALHSNAAERLGYPTQKPQALLERVIDASCPEGGIVLDPFCGCGTAIEAAEDLERNWVGVDITHLAISLIKHRLQRAYGDDAKTRYEVIGEPVTLHDAKTLARDDPYQFQYWALGLVGARPDDEKKGRDKGIDGRLFFHDDGTGETKNIVLSVKSGWHVSPSFVRDLRGVMDREHAQIGVLITLTQPTRDMKAEATDAGIYKSAWGNHPRLQILTVEELLSGKTIDRPPTKQADTTFKKRPKSIKKSPEQLRLPR